MQTCWWIGGNLEQVAILCVRMQPVGWEASRFRRPTGLELVGWYAAWKTPLPWHLVSHPPHGPFPLPICQPPFTFIECLRPSNGLQQACLQHFGA